MADLEARRVLVVEDEFYLARDLAETLKAQGAAIMGPFPRRDAALAALAGETPDCAVIDVNLGGGADFGLADELQARGVPFLFFTGYDPEVIPERFSGVRRMEKPVDSLRLASAVEALCSADLAAVNTG